MKKIDDLMTADWAAAFREIDPEIDAKIAKMGEFLRAEIASGHQILPAPENIFRAFSRNLTDIKVLIVGQDPYPTIGAANGLAFSVSRHFAKIPQSLKNISHELYDDILENPRLFYGEDFAKNPNFAKIKEMNLADFTTRLFVKTNRLESWKDQNVCLLNKVLTVRAGEPNSHLNKGWEEITETAVKIIANRDEIFVKIHKKYPELFEEFVREAFPENHPLVVILWGNNARSFTPIFAKNDRILVLESAHPSPLSARRGFFGSRQFSRTNDFLMSQGAISVDWLKSSDS